MPEVTPICQFGTKAISFSLNGVDKQIYSLEQIKGKNGTLVFFICNHCPYVKGVIDRLVSDIENLQKKGIGCVAIMSNDVEKYPEDSFDNMKIFAQENSFKFPYLIDETQEVARNYKAICTPDFFGFNKFLELQYRGRIDSGTIGKEKNIERELFKAMELISNTNEGPKSQNNSIGCSIKWKKDE